MGLFTKSPDDWYKKAIQEFQKENDAKGVQYLEKAAAGGHGKAMALLAECYLEGTGVKEDPAKAAEYFHMAMAHGEHDAWLALGQLYHHGSGDTFKANPYMAVFCYENAAAWDNVEAMLRLGNMYEQGIGIEKDPDKAIEWYVLASEKKCPTAMAYLGTMCAQGKDMKKNAKEARRWYQKAVNHAKDHMKPYDSESELLRALNWMLMRDDPDQVHEDDWEETARDAYLMGDYEECCAFCEKIAKMHPEVNLRERETDSLFGETWAGLALPYQASLEKITFVRGDAVFETADEYWKAAKEMENEKWYEAANKYYEKSALLGNPRGIHALAVNHIEGNGVPKDVKKGVELMQQAAMCGDENAQTNLGLYYLDGKCGLEQDAKEAYRYLKQAADAGAARAVRLLGEMYAEGHGVKQDLSRAVELYQAALEAGDVRAAYELAWVYREQKLEDKDHEKELYYYEKAASMDHRAACVEVGQYYLLDGTSNADYDKAEKYLRKAVSLGSENCFENLGLLYGGESFGRADGPQAIYWYKKAAEQGNVFAEYIVGKFYYDKGDCPSIKASGKKRIEKAAAQGLEEAVEWMKKH